MIRLVTLPLLLALVACDRADAPQPVNNTVAAAAPMTEAQAAYSRAMTTMHADMGAPDPDPDVAFAKGMIPHHRGAIEMARVELRYGRDPEMRRLAQAVVAAQDAEIALMERWLKARGVAPALAEGDRGHAH